MGRRSLPGFILGLVAGGCILAVALMYEPAFAPVEPPPVNSFDAGLRARGARIVALGDCVVCHTAKDGKPLAGGLPLITPFGTIYTTNITPDKVTGIGSWSLEAFGRAMRQGISRDGHHLYPAFPYVHFTRVPDADIDAAYAYLMSRPPVSANPPMNDLMFPLGFRPLVAFWNLLFLQDRRYVEETTRSREWNRGKLLVDGLGHCASCHSPLNLAGAEKASLAFEGGRVDGWDAYPLINLNNSPVSWTKEQLVTYLRTGIASQHGGAAGPMLPVTQGLATTPEEDAQAIAQYVLSLQKPQQKSIAIKTRLDGRSSSSVAQGSIIFAGACAACHGMASPMQSIGNRPSLSLSTAVNADGPRNVIQMMLNGIAWHQTTSVNYMPAFEADFSNEQLADIAAYVRSNFSHRPEWPDVSKTVSEIKRERAR
ncbi:c-type cytochrome [Paraburkholderia sediminicola]|uniref:c-type cytochrome n=1 Tax=Paraburkholderia sediminicola TaxID=458836 RepID=UPI0038BAE6CB